MPAGWRPDPQRACYIRDGVPPEEQASGRVGWATGCTRPQNILSACFNRASRTARMAKAGSTFALLQTCTPPAACSHMLKLLLPKLAVCSPHQHSRPPFACLQYSRIPEEDEAGVRYVAWQDENRLYERT